MSDRLLDFNQGAVGDCLVFMIIPDAVFEEYEWIEKGKPYREENIPAAVLNQFGPPTISNEDEVQLGSWATTNPLGPSCRHTLC